MRLHLFCKARWYHIGLKEQTFSKPHALLPESEPFQSIDSSNFNGPPPFAHPANYPIFATTFL
jgi:hypothetical protein